MVSRPPRRCLPHLRPARSRVLALPAVRCFIYACGCTSLLQLASAIVMIAEAVVLRRGCGVGRPTAVRASVGAVAVVRRVDSADGGFCRSVCGKVFGECRCGCPFGAKSRGAGECRCRDRDSAAGLRLAAWLTDKQCAGERRVGAGRAPLPGGARRCCRGSRIRAAPWSRGSPAGRRPAVPARA